MRTRILFFWTILILLTAGNTTSGQTPPAVTYKAIKLTGNNGPYEGEVTGLVFDKRGVGWVSTRDGLFIFDGQQLYRASDYYPGNEKILNSQQSAVLYDSVQNALYLFTNIDDHICIYLLNIELLTHSGSSAAAQLIYTEKWRTPPQVLVHRRSFYFVFDGQVVKLELFGLKDVRRISTPDIQVESIFFSGNSLYVVSWNNSTCYSIQYGRDTGVATIIRKFRTKEEYLDFIGVAAGGGSEANPGAFPNDKVEKITGLIGKVQELPDNFFDSKSRVGLAEDRYGNYYIYSGYGIIKLVRQDSYSIQALPAVFETRAIWYNEKEKQGLVATDNGLLRYNLRTKQYDYLMNAGNKERNRYYFTYSFINDSSLLFFGENTKATALRVNIKNYSYQTIPLQRDIYVFGNYLDPHTGELFTAYDTLYSAYLHNDTVQFKERLFSDNSYISGLAGAGDQLLIATGKGLYDYSISRKSATLISEGSFLCIIPYKEGWLAGTQASGIYFISAKGTITEFISTEQGLINNTVYSLLYDESTRLLWVGTKKGLSAYHTEYRVFKNYTSVDGLADNEFNKFSAYRSLSGAAIFMGGVKGLTVIDNNAITDISLLQKTAPVIMGVDLIYNNEAKDFFSLPFHPEDTVFEVKPLIRSVSLRITKRADEKIFYLAYKIDNGDWKYSLGDEPITLYGLGAGSHSVQVKYAGASGTDGPVATIRFYIKQVWYKKIWAIVLFALLLGGIIYKLFKWRIDIVEAQSLRELNKYRELMLGVIAHDLRSPLTAYQGLADVISSLIKEKQYDRIEKVAAQIDSTGVKLNLLMNNLLNWNLLQQKKMVTKKETLNLLHFLEEHTAIYQELAVLKGIKIRVQQTGHPVIESDRDMVSLIIRNLLDNAIKNAPLNKDILVSLVTESQETVLKVSNAIHETDREKLENVKRLLEGNKTWEPGAEGMGLGLKMVQMAAMKIGAQLGITTTDEAVEFAIRFN